MNHDPGRGQQQAAPPPVTTTTKWPYAVLVVALLVLAGGIWTAYDRGLIVDDSGVDACEAMRAGTATFPTGADDDEPMTEAQYRQARQVFAGSRHDDIRDHGTKLLDIEWRISESDDGKTYVQPLATQMLGLASACADQGVFLPVKAAAAPQKAATAAPIACGRVFRNGQTIATAFAGTCTGVAGLVQFVPAFDCKDGRKLYQVASSSGAKGGWGYAGTKYRAVGVATSDPAYSAAVQKCLG